MLDGVISIPFPSATRPACAQADRPEPSARREFIAGPENRLAAVAVLALATGRRYNPLVLYGPSGAGKSFLAEGLAAVFSSQRPTARAARVTALDFARRYAAAIDTSSTDEFFAEHRQLDLLVLEDLHLIAEKPWAQEAVVAIFDSLVAAQSLVVVTLPATPGAQTGLSSQLAGRLTGGLAIPLSLPGEAARHALVEQTLAELGAVDAPSPAELAGAFTGTVRQLQTAVRAYALTDPGHAALAVGASQRRSTIGEIAAATAKHFGLKVADLQGPSRRRHTALARGIAMWLSRELSGSSLSKIGDYFGRRDHTTVMHACRRLKRLVDADQEVRRSVEQLRAMLTS